MDHRTNLRSYTLFLASVTEAAQLASHLVMRQVEFAYAQLPHEPHTMWDFRFNLRTSPPVYNAVAEWLLNKSIGARTARL